MKFELFTVASLAAVAVADSAVADDREHYMTYYSNLAKLGELVKTGYISAINSFYARSDVAEDVNKLATLVDPADYQTYRFSFNAKYWPQLSSIYKEWNIDQPIATASPSALATGSGSSLASSGSSAASSASPRLSSASNSTSSTSSIDNFGMQQKPLWALTGLLGALPALLL